MRNALVSDRAQRAQGSWPSAKADETRQRTSCDGMNDKAKMASSLTPKDTRIITEAVTMLAPRMRRSQ